MGKKRNEDRYQEYLEVIHRISEEKKNKDEYISNIEIATHLHVKPPSVTEFLTKLERAGLIEYKKREGVKLTVKGYNLGKKVLYMHHLLESFLTKVLELEDRELKHRIACSLEHDLMEEPRLAKALEKSIEKVDNLASGPK